MIPLHRPDQNQLLAGLPAAELDLLAAHLELVPMRLGDTVYSSGERPKHAYFPTSSVISLHCMTMAGESAESTGVGREGVVGISLFMGGNSTPDSAVVQTAGHGYRLERRWLLQAFDRVGTMQGSLLRYTQALMTQVLQTAACYRHHSVEQQLSRLLLSTADRVPSADLVMTQELIAGLLGVRRESITQAAGRLQALNVIRYRRGHISLVDRAGLERCACECYGVVKKEMRRLLSA
jgi:CRP-like cAMP-binding protein